MKLELLLQMAHVIHNVTTLYIMKGTKFHLSRNPFMCKIC